MGWLFGKKKPKVPFPEPHPLDEGALRFPGRSSTERVIEPEKFKEAAGVERPGSFAPEKEEAMLLGVSAPTSVPPAVEESRLAPAAADEPLFVHIDVYRQILGSIDEIKRGVNSLQETCKRLETSEYNEEANFTKLRRAVKSMHDRLLHMDKVVFKSQGM